MNNSQTAKHTDRGGLLLLCIVVLTNKCLVPVVYLVPGIIFFFTPIIISIDSTAEGKIAPEPLVYRLYSFLRTPLKEKNRTYKSYKRTINSAPAQQL